MGAWGHNTFEDDSALDLIDEWIQSERPHDALDAAITQALAVPSLDYEQGQSVAVAAALVQFALVPDSTPESEELASTVEGFESWLATLSPERLRSLLPRLVQALDRLLAPASELAELWSENEELYPQWLQLHRDRQTRLRALITPAG